MAPVQIALALAQFAPTLMKFLGVGEDKVSVAEKAIDVATSVAGVKTPEEALEIFTKDQAKAWEFKLAILAQEKEFLTLYYADLESARRRDSEFVKAGKRNVRADSMYFLAVAVIVGLFYTVWKSPELDEFVKGIVSLVLGRFLGYLDGIYNFEFGSTRSSKDKDSTIQHLTRSK